MSFAGGSAMRKNDSVKLMFFRFLMICLAATFLLQSYGFFSAAHAEEVQVLSTGAKGDRVYEINKRLRELRYIKKGNVSKKYAEKTAEGVRQFQAVNGLPETGEVDEKTEQVLFSDNALKAPWPALPPLATPAPVTEPDWPIRDDGGFLAGKGEYVYENEQEGVWIYLGNDLQVSIRRHTDSSIPLIWFETDIRTRNGENFRAVMTDPEHPGTRYRFPFDIARNEGFVLGFSDDFFATRIDEKQTVGIIIRDGKIISSRTNRKTNTHLPNLDMLAQYSDGRFEVYECTEYTAQELVDKGVINVYSFGPILIRDGVINENLYTHYQSVEPRQALGMIEPGHYFLVSVQGRLTNSRGTNLRRVAEIMLEHGVTQALNLDGGNTMALVFRGNMLNKKATFRKRTFIRTVTTLIGIGYTENMAEQESR